ncbi:Imm58 family immunity protein [Dyella sp. 2HG41-7]|uniref:Imm58 family immunity protein n=1 Tax=Dyella sp. 2HG41-7 TaxID=2883239 RepID=UPI001F21B7D1|nr:Imm58 family immunity protein [Dyella sp. 2HG41-7]
MSTKVWKVTTILLALACAVLTYRVFDQGVTRTYLDASTEQCAKHSALLASIVEHEWSGLTEEQLMPKLKAYVVSRTDEPLVLKRDPETNTIYLDGVRFEFKDGKLVKVL